VNSDSPLMDPTCPVLKWELAFQFWVILWLAVQNGTVLIVGQTLTLTHANLRIDNRTWSVLPQPSFGSDYPLTI
jgi:hypothetical protein